MTTPGQLRQFAAQASRDAIDYRHWAHETTNPEKKRRYERLADNREDDARWYREVACRGEIEVEFTEITQFAEAAE